LSPLTLAARNVRSLVDNPRSNRLERRTVLVARELARYKLDIAALSETRFSEQGQLEEVGASYTVIWSGRPKVERCDAGVAVATRNDIVGRPNVERRDAGVAFAIRKLRQHQQRLRYPNGELRCGEGPTRLPDNCAKSG
uniref:Endo/exonuclease/phosphatase domain-containing protein n=1 Tax=Schistocephalus solidus TaxID=70667 RepID=A0A183TNU4_SCHSO